LSVKGPIILSSTATGGHKKPLGITLGIMISFALFTLTISYIVRIIPFDPNALRLFAVIIIGFLGITLVVPQLSSLLEGYVSRLSGMFGNTNDPARTGFWGGLITGLALGVVWTPCAGPILATIATLAATTAVNMQVVLVTIVYVIGVGIPLFLFATIGRVLFMRSRLLSQYTGRIQQVFGVIMILTAVAIYTNYDKTLQAKLLDAFPAYGNFVVDLESNDAVNNELEKLKGKKGESEKSGAVFELFPSNDEETLFNTNTKAPEFIGITKWLNPEKALTMESLKGKVVLVDFWTYTCINCIRTLPYVTSWYDKYKDDGFVVIGVHTPEFEFEKNTTNVLQAIKQYNIHYPVAQDNNFATWNAYSNQYWPAKYLIDKNGVIRYTHFGEGEYETTEKAIQVLLKETGKDVSKDILKLSDQTPKERLSPETYLGSKRMEYLYPNGHISNGKYRLVLSDNIPVNSFSLGGEWQVTDEYSRNLVTPKPILEYRFYANKVFLVLKPGFGTPVTGGKVKVFLDGELVNETNAGIDVDVEKGIVLVNKDNLYNLIDLKGKPGEHLLRLEFEDLGIEAYAFTFG
jgi:cytochrome c biogenesis protein CcdA/thiol-disulfide isomerase/thioredoxin